MTGIFLLCVFLFVGAFVLAMYIAQSEVTGMKKRVLATVAIMMTVSFIPSCVYYHVDNNKTQYEKTVSYLETNGYTAKIIDHRDRHGYVLQFEKTGERLVIYHIHIPVAVGDVVRVKADGGKVVVDCIIK